jgi:hypothetical protein
MITGTALDHSATSRAHAVLDYVLRYSLRRVGGHSMLHDLYSHVAHVMGRPSIYAIPQ